MSKQYRSGRRMLSLTGASLALLGAAALPPCAAAQSAAVQSGAVPAAPLPPEIPVAGAGNALTVVRDAATGQLRAPTADEQAALQSGAQARSLRVAPAVPLQKFHASGAQGVRLTRDFMSTSVAVRGSDGKLATQCTEAHGGEQSAPHIHATQPPTE